MKKLELRLTAAVASVLTALATVVAMAEAQPAVLPANTEAPAVVGTAQDGELLAARDGEWSGTDPMTFTYQWQVCDVTGGNCANVNGATAKIYRIATTDVGRRLRVQVTAKNTSGSKTATTA